MFLVSPTEWFYRDRWCHCCVLPGWGLGEGKGEATCPSQPALALSAPAGGFKRSGILHLGILDGASYIPLHLDFFRIGFFFSFCNKKREREQNLQSDFCSLFFFAWCLQHLKGFWLWEWVNVAFHLWGGFFGGWAGVFQSMCALQKMRIRQHWLLLWWGLVQLWLEWDSFGMGKGLGLWLSIGWIMGSVQMFVHFPSFLLTSSAGCRNPTENRSPANLI